MSHDSIRDEHVSILADLVRVIAEADGFVTLEESDGLDAIAHWIGEDRFSTAFAESRKKTIGLSDLERLASGIDDASARKTCYQMLKHLAASDEIDSNESSALETLRSLWRLDG